MDEKIQNFAERIKNLEADMKLYGEEILSLVNAQQLHTLTDNDIQKSNKNSGSTRFDMKTDPRNTAFILRQDYTDLLETLQTNKITVSMLPLASTMKDMDHCIHFLEAVADISSKLIVLEVNVNTSNLKLTCSQLLELEELLNKKLMIPQNPLQTRELATGVVCRTLRKEFFMIKSRFETRLIRLLSLSCVIETGRISINKELSGVIAFEETIIEEPIRIEDIWSSLISLNLIENQVLKILQQIWNLIILPLWNERKPPNGKFVNNHEYAELSFEAIMLQAPYMSNRQAEGVDDLNGQGTSNSRIRSSSNQNVNTKEMLNCRMQINQLIDTLSNIFPFIYKQVFSNMTELFPFISDGLASSDVNFLCSLYDTIVHAIPIQDEDISNFHKLLDKPLLEFEKILITYEAFDVKDEYKANLEKLSSTRSCYQGISYSEPLSALLVNIDNHFIEKRRKEILVQARSIVMADYHNIMLASGDAQEDETTSAGHIGDPSALLEQSGSYAIQSLRFEPCQISLASCRLLKLIHEIMKRINDQDHLSVRMTSILHQTVRDCLEMYLLIVPIKYASVIDNNPRMGAIFYNDCLYIIHNSTLISHIYRKDSLSSNDTSANISFLDLIPRFRAIGEKILTYHLDNNKKEINQFVVSININVVTTSSSKDGKFYNNEQYIDKIIHFFEKLRESWNDVFQDNVYQRLMGHLIETLLHQIMDPILSSDCISESSASDISRLMKSLQRIKTVIFPGVGDDYITRNIATSWNKFCTLADLLEFSLSEIAEFLPRYDTMHHWFMNHTNIFHRRKFASFTGQEMSSLIKALFDDSSKRQILLNSVIEMSN